MLRFFGRIEIDEGSVGDRVEGRIENMSDLDIIVGCLRLFIRLFVYNIFN